MDPFFQKNHDFQHSILYGALLGDASFYPRKGILQLEQCAENGDYLFWLFENLKSLTTGKPPSLVKRLDKRNGKETHSSRFYTRALFHHWRPHFYHENGVKKLPENFEECLDSTALAVWFLDDGGRRSDVQTGVFLTVHNYTLNEIKSIQRTLFTRFDLETRYQRNGKSTSGTIQKRVAIPGDNYTRFVDSVSPVILQIPSMVGKKLKGV